MRETHTHKKNQAKTTVITVAGKLYQWMLKSVGESLRKNRIWAECQRHLTIFKNHNFIVQRPSRYHLPQMIKVSITSNNTYMPK